MPHRKNFLLNSLEPALLAELEPHLSVIELHHTQVLAETHQRIERVYFPAFRHNFLRRRTCRRRGNRDRHDRQ